jgi:Asp-tRNA(Asn)/Glu-tRNA(Gln) amidotransferase A subunit family amidase
MSNPYAFAARQPLALLVLLAAVLGGLIIYLWLLPLGLLAYGAMVVLGGRDPHLAAASQRASQRSTRSRLSSPTFRAQLNAVERIHAEIERSVGQASGPLSRLLARITSQTEELVEQAYGLCQRGQVIEGYLARVNPQELQGRIANTDRQIAATADPYTLQQLQETRAALAEKQRNAAELTTYVGRIQAQLQNIHANLDNVLSETVRLRTADALAADSATNQVAQRLADLKSDMDTFQRVLDTALATATP